MNIRATDTKAVPTDFAPASLSDKAATYALDAAKSIGRLAMRRVKRTADVVDSEYNLLHWQRTLSEKSWTRSASIVDFIAPRNSASDLRKVDNQICRVAADDYYRYRARALGELLARYTGDATEIIELGAGCGVNLLSLHLNHPDWRLRGFDIAPNGIAAGREIAAHYGLSDRISLDRIDLTDGTDPNYSAIKDKVVFTYFCIEQIPYDVRKVVDNIIAARPKRVINIEPTTELLNFASPRDIVSFLYIRSVDYQTQLFSTLDDYERQGRVRILARDRMPFAPTIHNDGFLYCWEPT
ncbi:class I SAM-dependent methyltransferase [Bradyrhizobium liaoningense]|uniref:class I SAM-dependent methyltransferase n=1 Tax=Bradyrhizobium liaoningense TaxID=43992 RepID=UPI001BA91B1D|nr:class I SAM-dependent methyltransferase [Bradyrhizobium liaoningense]MBR0709330.1 class I SAM-dependent methyltransferase [Bradyrhizobium liaoningense]